LAHWQKEAVERMSAAQIGAWLGCGDPPEFVELVRHNVVLPADAAPWRAVVRGDLPPLGQDEERVIAAAGPEFFAAAAAAFDQSSSDLKTLTKILKERTGRKGADLYMPLRGTRPRTRIPSQAHAAGDGAPPPRVPCLKYTIRSPARKKNSSLCVSTKSACMCAE
jgi:hypothetical protein